MAYTNFTIQNLSTTTTATINSILVTDNANILHHSNFSNFGGDFAGDIDNTSNTTVVTKNKNYVTGSPLLKAYASATFPIDVQYKGHTGTTLIVDSTVGLLPSWVADSDDDAYDGLYIVSVTSATWLEMSGTPIGTPVLNGNITFSTSTHELTLQSPDTTSGLGPGWTITSNGYDVIQNAYIISVKDSSTLIVDQLPVSEPTVGNDMVFTSSTNFLTLNNVTDLDIGWSLSGNGYNGTQRISSIDVGADTVITDLPPNGFPSNSGGPITFTSDYTLYTLEPLASVTFSMDYTNVTTTVGPSYPSLVTINAIQGAPVVKLINNYVAINAAPVSPIFSGRGGGGGGGSFGGGSGGQTTGLQGKPGESNMANAGAGLPGGTEGQGPPGGNGGGGEGGGGIGNGGGGGLCHAPWVRITMVDGSYKQIQDIQVGDLIQGNGCVNTVITSVAIYAGSRLVSFNGIDYFVTEIHPMLTDIGWGSFNPVLLKSQSPIYYEQLKANNNGNDLVTISEGSNLAYYENNNIVYVPVSNVQYESRDNFIVYQLNVSGNDTFIAENIISHNK